MNNNEIVSAMKQALEFIEETNKSSSFWMVPASKLNKTVNALRQAIATEDSSATQEPVAWYRLEDEERIYYMTKAWDNCIPLYTHPQPKREPLTDEQIEKLIFKSGGHKSTQNLMSNPMQVREYVELWNERIYAFARAIEAAHGIKGEV